MAEAGEIFDYLPSSFKSQEEQKYVDFLWDSFQSNYQNQKYPFAFIAYHMLYMCFLYFEVWQIKENWEEDFAMAMVGFNKDSEKELLEATTPFAFWSIPERSFFRFLKLIECDNSRVGSFAKIVDLRNNAAHSNGNIFFNAQESIDEKIDEILTYIDEIQTHSYPVIEDCLIRFLKESANLEDREFLDDADQIREILIHKNYLSQKDIEHLATFDISLLGAEARFEEIKRLFENFRQNYLKAAEQ